MRAEMGFSEIDVRKLHDDRAALMMFENTDAVTFNGLLKRREPIVGWR